MISGQMSTPPRERRVAGYRQALSDHAIPLDEMLVIGSDFTERGGYEAMQAILALAERPTAVFGANDLIAIGAMLAIRDAGLNIPGDIAVVGMDNIPAARLVHPALTTIDQFPEKSGKKATEMLFERLNGQFVGGVRNHEMPFQLVIRESA